MAHPKPSGLASTPPGEAPPASSDAHRYARYPPGSAPNPPSAEPPSPASLPIPGLPCSLALPVSYALLPRRLPPGPPLLRLPTSRNRFQTPWIPPPWRADPPPALAVWFPALSATYKVFLRTAHPPRPRLSVGIPRSAVPATPRSAQPPARKRQIAPATDEGHPECSRQSSRSSLKA